MPAGRDLQPDMILPCRIHRARNRHRVDSLPLALLFAAFYWLRSAKQSSQETSQRRRSEAAGLGWLPAIPIQITAGGDAGYDDNVTAAAPSGEGSLFTRENVVLTYDRPWGTDTIFCGGCRTL